MCDPLSVVWAERTINLFSLVQTIAEVCDLCVDLSYFLAKAKLTVFFT
jgi:hypothetical protein